MFSRLTWTMRTGLFAAAIWAASLCSMTLAVAQTTPTLSLIHI